MKSLIQEYTMIENINYNDQSKCFENITKFMILDDQLSVYIFNGLIHNFFLQTLTSKYARERHTIISVLFPFKVSFTNPFDMKGNTLFQG